MSENKNENLSLTLNELKGERDHPTPSSSEDLAGAQPIDISEHIKPKKSAEDKLVEQEYAEMDDGISRFLGEIDQTREEMYEEEINKALDEDDDTPPIVDAVTGLPINDSTTTQAEDDVDFDDDADTNTDSVSKINIDPVESIDSITFLDDDEDLNDTIDNDNDESMENFKKVIKEKVTPVNNPVNLTTFKIAKKAIGISRVLSANSNKKRHVADWVLYTSKRPISIQAIAATDIEKFNPNSSSRNRLNTYKDMYQVIYNNLVDDNKPESFEAWTKTLNFFDVSHLYFAIFKANFGTNTSLPYTCPKCKKISMVDVDIEKMVKYATPEVKAEVERILAKDTTSPDTLDTDLIQLSDEYACTLRFPTVYSVIIENASLDSRFTEKYSDLLGIISYIEEMYYIDKDSQQLIPISTNPDPTDIQKTAKRKIKAYNEILKTLTSDQYNALLSAMKELNDKGEGITYCQPEVNCPECGELIPEQEQDPVSLLFTRHQLVALASL